MAHHTASPEADVFIGAAPAYAVGFMHGRMHDVACLLVNLGTANATIRYCPNRAWQYVRDRVLCCRDHRASDARSRPAAPRPKHRGPCGV